MKAGLLALALLFVPAQVVAKIQHTDNQCLASAIYHEGRGESLRGQRAILDVILNRMKATGKSACAVIKAKAQFSWVGLKPMKKYNKKMQEMLTRVMLTRRILINENFKYFFSTSLKVRPRWARKMTCRQIGNHLFCRLKFKDKRNVQKR